MEVVSLRNNLSRWLMPRGFLTAASGVFLIITLVSFSYCHGEQKTSSPAEPAKEGVPSSSQKQEPDRPSFDLSYVPPDVTGVIAIRPNVLFSDPAMRPFAASANAGLTELLQSWQLSIDPKLPIEDIEQVIGIYKITPKQKATPGIHNFLVAPVMIRVAHDFNWRKVMRQLDPKPEEIRGEQQIYYKNHPHGFPGIPPGADFYYSIPDQRTLVLPFPGTLRINRKGEIDQPPPFSPAENWNRCERCLFAITMDNRWTHGLSKDQVGGDPIWAGLYQHVARIAVGLNSSHQ